MGAIQKRNKHLGFLVQGAYFQYHRCVTSEINDTFFQGITNLPSYPERLDRYQSHLLIV